MALCSLKIFQTHTSLFFLWRTKLFYNHGGSALPTRVSVRATERTRTISNIYTDTVGSRLENARTCGTTHTNNSVVAVNDVVRC